MRSEILTKNYGLITDCIAEFCKEMRKVDFTHEFDKYFSLNKDFNTRDEIAVRKTFSGLCKILFPDGEISKEHAQMLLEYAIEGRRRVKEQLRIMAGVEFIDVNLGYCDNENGIEKIVYVPEQSENTLIPENALPCGHIFAVGKSFNSGETCMYRLENKTINGSGKLRTQGVPYGAIAQCVESAWAYFKDNAKKVISGVNLTNMDYLFYYADTQNKGRSDEISVAEFIALCSVVMQRPVLESLAVAGELKLSGTIEELTNLDDILRVSKNAGAKRILIPMDSIKDIQNIPRELLCDIQPLFYSNPIDAAKKALSLI